MWRDILKVQILDTVTDLNIDLEPMAEDKKDCCQEAKEAYKETYVRLSNFGTNKDYEVSAAQYDKFVDEGRFSNFLDLMSCDEFAAYLFKPMKYKEWKEPLQKIIDDWEDCEDE